MNDSEIVEKVLNEKDALNFMSSIEFAPIDKVNYMKNRMEEAIAEARKEMAAKVEKFKVIPTQYGKPRGYYISISTNDWETLKKEMGK